MEEGRERGEEEVIMRKLEEEMKEEVETEKKKRKITNLTAIKIGRFMRRVRNKKELTQREVAITIGMTQGSLSKIERGFGVPDVIEWVAFCELTQLLCDTALWEQE